MEKKAEAMLPSVSLAPDLRAAVRRARIEEAERTTVLTELRSSELARLETLSAMLQPVFAQIRDGSDLFDCGVSGGDRPRLFIDMIAFVDMGHDRKTYRFVKDSREGRQILAEDSDPQAIVDAVANYIARRIVEREKALAGEAPSARPESKAEPSPGAAAPLPQAGASEFIVTFLGGAASGAAVLYALLRAGILG
jgi:hypothetical protein